MPPFRAYILCTSPRSGSTLLCSLLTATGVAGRPKSYFHRPSLAAWRGYFDLPPAEGVSDRDLLAEIVERAITQGRDGTDLFGLRLQRGSADFFMGQMAVLNPDLNSDVERIEAVFGRTLFIHLSRRDKVDQAISFVKAQQTGLWHRAPDGTELERLAPPSSPVYDAAAIRASVEQMTEMDHDWERWFAAEAIEPLRIDYDAFSAAPIETLRRILARLGRDARAADGVELGVAKLADATSRDWAARFRAESAPQ